MSDIVHLLPDNIANQIAAGEVIQRPASVVKELVENAVDAGSTDIRVNIKDAGRTLIQVIDNGKGMSATDARMAFERHATSKISTADDLYSLHTMGFRGEALASIVSVAQVELRTRPKGEELGSHLVFSGSELETVEMDACAEGSCFSVKNLFFNVPARRKFLKTNETEFRNIVSEFERVALVNPEIAFSLYHNDTEILNLPGSGLRQRIINIYGKRLNEKLLTIDAQSSLVTVSGFVGRPDTVKKRGSLQFFFVNGRFMKHPGFHKAVMQAYEHLIPAGEYPNYFIYFTLDPSTIDVNIHPTKTEIKFENEQPIWQIIVAAIREALAKSSAIPTLDFDVEDTIDIPVYHQTENTDNLSTPTVKVNTSYNPFNTSSYSKPEFDWAKLYGDFEEERKSALSADNEHENIETKVSTMDSSEGLLVAVSDSESLSLEVDNVCFQYQNRYIVTSLKSGLAIIDQHRAHIRILYEQYLQQIHSQHGVSQQLLFPDVIELTPVEYSCIKELLLNLQFVGFDLTDLGGNSYGVNGIPSGIDTSDPVGLLHDLLVRVIEKGSKVEDEVGETIALALAKSAAIPVGKFLPTEEIDHLLASLFSCTNSNITPDGKTIVTVLTNDELARRFK